MARLRPQATFRQGKRRRVFTGPGLRGRFAPMNDILLLCGIVIAWFVIVRFVFPRLGIRG